MKCSATKVYGTRRDSRNFQKKDRESWGETCLLLKEGNWTQDVGGTLESPNSKKRGKVLDCKRRYRNRPKHSLEKEVEKH